MRQPWPDERVERLKAMLAQGFSAARIAEALGVSRNAVIGKAQRVREAMGEPRRKRIIVHPRLRVRRQNRPSKPNAEHVWDGAYKHSKPKQAPTVTAWEAIPGSVPIGLMELTSSTCRWPIGDTRPYSFCGLHVTTGTYCAEHAARSVRRAAAPVIMEAAE